MMKVWHRCYLGLVAFTASYVMLLPARGSCVLAADHQNATADPERSSRETPLLAVVDGEPMELDYLWQLPDETRMRLSSNPKGLLEAAVERRLLLEYARKRNVMKSMRLGARADAHRAQLLKVVEKRVTRYRQNLAVAEAKAMGM